MHLVISQIFFCFSVNILRGGQVLLQMWVCFNSSICCPQMQFCCSTVCCYFRLSAVYWLPPVLQYVYQKDLHSDSKSLKKKKRKKSLQYADQRVEFIVHKKQLKEGYSGNVEISFPFSLRFWREKDFRGSHLYFLLTFLSLPFSLVNQTGENFVFFFIFSPPISFFSIFFPAKRTVKALN